MTTGDEDIRARLALFQQIFESVTDWQTLLRVDRGNRFVVVATNRAMNEAMARITGLQPAVIEGHEMEDVFCKLHYTPEQIQFRRSVCEAVVRDKTMRSFLGAPAQPNTSGESAEVSVFPILDQTGECSHLLFSARVVTRRLKAEAELREREERLRLIFNAHQDLQSLFRLEPDGRFINESFNEAAIDYAKQFIADPEEYLERERDEFLRALGAPEHLIEDRLAAWREVAQRGIPMRTNFDVMINPATGHRETGEMTMVPILNREGRCTHLLWTGHLTTERRRVEEELRKRGQDLAEAQRIAHIGSWTWDVEAKSVTWSDEMYRIVGREIQQDAPPLPGFLALIPEEEREHVKKGILDAYRARVGHDIEHRIVRPDGTERFVRTQSSVHLDSAGRALRISGTLHDITEQKLAVLREGARLRRLKQLSELSMMLSGDPATVFDRLVRMIAELFEVPIVEVCEVEGSNLIYRTVYVNGKVTPDAGSCPLDITPCATVAAAGEIRTYAWVQESFPAVPFLREHSADSWCGVPSVDGSGKVVAITCLVDDRPHDYSEEDRQILRVIGQRIATELERARSLASSLRMAEELRENERRLEESQRMAHLGSWYSEDLPGGVMTWSDEVYRIYEIERGTVPLNLELVMARAHPDDHALILKTNGDLARECAHFSEAGEKGDLEPLVVEHIAEHRLVMPDGRVKYVALHGTVKAGTDGKPQMRGTIQDVTERRRAEQEREKLQAQLARAQQMESIGRLAGGVAHDFNNMLTVILGYAAMIKEALPADPSMQLYINEIIKAGSRSKDLTQKLLGFSRRQIIAPVSSNLNELVADLQEPLARLIGEDVELLFNPGKDLWKVLVDPSQINQILLNLIVNARDAMPGGGRLTIDTENADITREYYKLQAGARPGQYVLLSVSDTGVGISEETLPHIFEPFFTTKEKDKGTGLGLATVYGIVQQNGGFVNVSSEPGHGTIFKIYFPREASKTVGEKIVPEEGGKRAGQGKILLVEDDELVRTMTTAALERIGYTPLVAASPEEALELYSRAGSDIRLMLTDVVMPGMNGMQLRDRMRALNPRIKVLFMSGYTSNVIVNHGVLKKGVHFIQKPFSIESLGRQLEEILAADEA